MPEKYYLYINRERVEVSEEVCYVFMRSIWNERKRRKYRSKVERSFEKYLELGLSFASEDELVEDIVTDQILLEALFDALQELSTEERELIDALFYQEKTLREILAEEGDQRGRHRLLPGAVRGRPPADPGRVQGHRAPFRAGQGLRQARRAGIRQRRVRLRR